MMHEVGMKTRCPFCGLGHGFAGNMLDDAAPEDGDLALCVGCGEWVTFDRHWQGGMRKPTPEEYADIVANPYCQAMRAAWLIAVLESAKAAGS